MLQVPSKSNPARTYRVNLAARGCSCPGWEFRKTCSHLRAAERHPGRYVEVGEDRDGLWVMGARWASPDQALRFFDQARIAVLADRIAGVPVPAWDIDLGEWCKAQGLRRLKFGDIARVATMQRVCQVINGDVEFRRVGL